MRVTATFLSFMLLLVFGLSAGGDEKKEPAKQTGLERFKQLAGEWVGKEGEEGKKGAEFVVKYKVSSGGSAVVETIMPDSEREMITVIHKDGDKLALTHYCSLGNQPRMEADAKGDGNKVEFKFVSASNMKSEKAMHMHDVTFTFVDKDTLKTEWVLYDEGKKTTTAVFDLKRKK
jgi:hypothetical protein